MRARIFSAPAAISGLFKLSKGFGVGLSAVLGLLLIALPETTVCAASREVSASSPTPITSPAIETLLKPEIYKRVLKDREIFTSADLKKIEDPKVPDSKDLKDYSFYAVMLTRAGVSRTRQVLTDYQLYSKLIPYVDEARYDSATHLLELKGGIWKWKLSSLVRFDERSDRWIHYQIVGGHFTGMSGDIFFEPQMSSRSEGGTLVYMRGNQQGRSWPPAFILEQGAQIVFEFTAKRMRSYLESNSEIRSGRSHDETPKPRSHL